MIEYTSEIGWHGILNEHGVTVWDEKDNRKMSSSSPAGHTPEWLKEMVDELPDAIRELLEEQCRADAEE
jgi:hypothetical protein